MDQALPVKVIIFDAYGTLFDVYSISQVAEEIFPGHGERLAELWRDRQIDYTRIRTLSDQYRDFWLITVDALNYACARLGLDLNDDRRAQLLDQYGRLSAFPENIQTLQTLRARGFRLGILTNGNRTMIDQNIQSAQMTGLFDHVQSVEKVGKFKTAPQAYQLGPDAFDLPSANILFVSSNNWDICGAGWFGYHTFWVNRASLPPEQLGIGPNGQGADLTSVVSYLDALRTD